MEKYTYHVELDEWVTNILGIPLETLNGWTNIFTKRKVFKDSIVAGAVLDFLAGSTDEKKLYEPFCTFGDRVLALGREFIEDLPPYPVEGLSFLRNDPHRLPAKKNEADRSPDIVLTTRATKAVWSTRPGYKKTKHATSGIEWSDILCILEGKAFRNSEHAEMIGKFWKARSAQEQVALTEVR